MKNMDGNKERFSQPVIRTGPLKHNHAAETVENLETLSVEEIRQKILDLRTHQIELQMQNEELRRTQAELDASRARYFDFYDMAPVGYITVNELGQILDANLTFARMLGVIRSSLVKQPISRFILPEDQDNIYLHRKQVFATGEQHTSEVRMMTMNGTPFWGQLAAIAAHDHNGEPVCRIVVSDITDRKRAEETLQRSEEKFSKAFKASPEAIALASMEDGKFLEVNEVFLKITGFARGEVIGRTATEMNVWTDLGERRRFYDELAHFGYLRDFETLYRMRNGEVRKFLVSSEIIKLEGKKCTLNFFLER